MDIRRIVPDISSTKLEESKKFYAEFLGLKLAMDMNWILTFISNSNPMAQVNILLSDQPNVDNSNVVISIEVSAKDRSILRWTQEGFANEQGQKHSENTLLGMLERIKKLVEKE